MLTGADLAKYLNLRLDKDYSGYFNPSKLNAAIRAGFYKIVERKYQELSSQKTYDELTGFIKTNVAIDLFNSLLFIDPLQIINVTGSSPATITTLNAHRLVNGQSVTISGVDGITGVNGTFVATVTGANTFTIPPATTGTYTANTGSIVPSNGLSDYLHHLTSFSYILGQDINISSVTAGTNTIVATSQPHNLRTKDSVFIENVVGITGINQEHTNITVLNKTKFSIGTTTGTYTSGGTVNLVNNNSTKLRRSNAKGYYATEPTNIFPTHEMTNGTIVFSPTASKVTLDYITKLPVEIDVNDDVIDLEITYNPKFLYYLIDNVVFDLSGDNRDSQLRATTSQDVAMNP